MESRERAGSGHLEVAGARCSWGRPTSFSRATSTSRGRRKASHRQVRPASPPYAAHPLTRAPRRPSCSRAPCTRHRADSSSHSSCLRRTISVEVLGSKLPSRCSLWVPAAPKSAGATGCKRWQEEAAVGPCRAPVRTGSHRHASWAPQAPLGRVAAFRPRTCRLCGS